MYETFLTDEEYRDQEMEDEGRILREEAAQEDAA